MESGMSAAGPSTPRGKRHKVVLYNPQAVFFTMPLALLAIGSELDPDVYEVITIDARLEADAQGTVLSHIEDALCVGITVLTGAPISDALEISRAVKRARPDLPVVWGGWHPSMFASECLLEPSVDVTVRGQGEETFAEIVQRLARAAHWRVVPGAPSGSPMERSTRIRPAAGLRRQIPRAQLRPDPVERYFQLKGKRQLDYISSRDATSVVPSARIRSSTAASGSDSSPRAWRSG